MKRFLKSFGLLLGVLLFLVSGIDTALDRLAVSPEQGSFMLLNEKGESLLTYNGNLAHCEAFTRPLRNAPPALLPHRGLAPRA